MGVSKNDSSWSKAAWSIFQSLFWLEKVWKHPWNILKKTRLFGLHFYVSLGCNIQKYHFSNQNKLWNMLQAAFDHEKSFFDTPKGWKPSFQWVFDVINFKILHLFNKNTTITLFQKVSYSSGAAVWAGVLGTTEFRLEFSAKSYVFQHRTIFCIFENYNFWHVWKHVEFWSL